MISVHVEVVRNTKSVTERGSSMNMADKNIKIIYPAFSKHLFYFRMHISKFILEQGGAPLNPFMIHEYFLLDSVPRDVIRQSNNAIVTKSDEVWVFGKISNGVLVEIRLAEKLKKNIRYFDVIDSLIIKEVKKKDVKLEEIY